MHRVLFALALVSCKGKGPVAPATVAPTPYAEVLAEVKAAMDPGADACEDFYRYACGGWLEANEIPGDQSRWTRSFSEIAAENETFIKEILESAAEDPSDDPDRKLIGDFYASCMNTDRIEAAALTPVQPAFDQIAGVSTAEEAWMVAGSLQHYGSDAFITGYPANDYKEPDDVLLFLVQNGLGLPDREYYLDASEAGQALLADYEAYVAQMLELSGFEGAEPSAAAVVSFERALAESHWERSKLRDPGDTWNPADRASLGALVPEVPWDGYFSALGYPDLSALNLVTPDVLAATAKAVAATEVSTLQAYLQFHVIHALGMKLHQPVRDAQFAFMGTRLNGTAEQPPRWKTCVRNTEGALGEVIGKVYVNARFAGESKAKALSMIQGIEASFEQGLPELEWMDDDTRAAAVVKARAITNKIGYPDRWRDYSSLQLVRDDFAHNHLQSIRLELKRALDKVGQPQDPHEWYMSPQVVNAYYNPPMNEIVFPAGILQPPFFSARFPAALNFGAMGMVMGHEITHGFDDEGRQFDGEGRFHEWWAPEVAERFEERAACVSEQYSAFEELPGKFVNGELTLGENIADIGGIKLAYRAYQHWKDEHGEEPLGDLSGDQLFFLGHAQAWCTEMTPEMSEVRLTTDPHAPARWRVIGPLRNLPDFAEAFSCKQGSGMAPKDYCEVW